MSRQAPSFDIVIEDNIPIPNKNNINNNAVIKFNGMSIGQSFSVPEEFYKSAASSIRNFIKREKITDYTLATREDKKIIENNEEVIYYRIWKINK